MSSIIKLLNLCQVITYLSWKLQWKVWRSMNFCKLTILSFVPMTSFSLTQQLAFILSSWQWKVKLDKIYLSWRKHTHRITNSGRYSCRNVPSQDPGWTVPRARWIFGLSLSVVRSRPCLLGIGNQPVECWDLARGEWYDGGNVEWISNFGGKCTGWWQRIGLAICEKMLFSIENLPQLARQTLHRAAQLPDDKNPE